MNQNTAETTDIEMVLGLFKNPKQLSSKYFYDQKGDALFRQIMQLPEYYLSRCELAIFKKHHAAIFSAFKIQKNNPFDLIELGAGDGSKTKVLLSYLLKNDYKFSYNPIDISVNSLNVLMANLSDLSDLNATPIQGDYFNKLNELSQNKKPKIVLFLGSNLGNMSDQLAKSFLHSIAKNLNPNDGVLLGVDMIKEPAIIMPAYNDSKGITSQFNLNLLTRINREFGGNFQLENFKHKPEYLPEGKAVSFLESKKSNKYT